MNFNKKTLTASVLALGLLSAIGAPAATAATPTNINVSQSLQISAAKAKTVKQTTSALNLRSVNSTKGKVLTIVPKNAKLSVIATSNGWSKVTYNKKTGWVSNKYLKIATNATVIKRGVVKATVKQTTASLNLRAAKTTKAKIIKVIPKNAKVTVWGTNKGWSKVKHGTKTGYVSAKYLKKPGAKTAVKRSVGATTEQAKRTKVIASAKKYLGVNYKWGGNNPQTGWDCSGYVKYVFNEAGMSVARTKAWVGSPKVSAANAEPGDLVVQRGGSHVGIYAGGGKMYHSANPKTGTVYASAYYSPPSFYNVIG